MKRCILHLGMPKTASTSMQTTLFENRALLKRYGWEYPVFTCPQHGHTFSLHNDPLCRLFMPGHAFHVQRPLKNGDIDLDLQQKGLGSELADYCQNTSMLVLSSEALLKPLPLSKISDFIGEQGYTIEPIIYVRSPYSYRVSIFQSLLKSSQVPSSVICEHLQTPVVKSAIAAAMEFFGDSVKFYPFNNLIRSNVDIVKHFLSHLLNDNVINSIQIIQENTSPSWQATALLEYIEEKIPSYIGNIKNNKRNHDDIMPLLQIKGEKFRFNTEHLSYFREVVDMENIWLRNNLGEEFCDVDYTSQVATLPMLWTDENIHSLLRIMPELPINIQLLIKDYLEGQAAFSSPDMKKLAVVGVRENIKKKKKSSRIHKIKKLFPAETKRGNMARKVCELLKS